MKRKPKIRFLKAFAPIRYSCVIPAMFATPSFAHDKCDRMACGAALTFNIGKSA